MDRDQYNFISLTNFAVGEGKMNLNNTMEQLPLKITSNGVNHSLVLIKPWRPLSRPPQTKLDELLGLSYNDVESVCAFKDSDNPRIEITMKNKDKVGITITYENITGLPNRTDGSS